MPAKQGSTKPIAQSNRLSKKEQRRLAKERQERNARNIRIIAIVVIAMVVVGVIWLIIANQKPAQSTSASVPTTSAPTVSIPTASGPTASAPTALAPTASGTQQWASAPPMTIDKTKQYFATVTMAKGGQFVIQLYPDKAPITVNSFIFLAQQGFFNGVTFHRVLEGFMAQGGDPTGTGGGGPGYQFVNENSDLTFDKPGVVAMANSGPNTNGSQFFITFAPYSAGNGQYTIFGQVISGMDVVNGIRLRDPNQKPTYPGDAIQTITIQVK